MKKLKWNWPQFLIWARFGLRSWCIAWCIWKYHSKNGFKFMNRVVLRFLFHRLLSGYICEKLITIVECLLGELWQRRWCYPMQGCRDHTSWNSTPSYMMPSCRIPFILCCNRKATTQTSVIILSQYIVLVVVCCVHFHYESAHFSCVRHTLRI